MSAKHRRQKGKRGQPEVPEPFNSIIKQACSDDRIYFEQNPNHSFYWRKYIPGELYPILLPLDTWIEVNQIRPELRSRTPHFEGASNKKDIEEHIKICGPGEVVLLCDEEGRPIEMGMG